MPTFDDGERTPTVRVTADGEEGTTYRLTDRAAGLVRELGYDGGEELPAELYRALRRVGDARPVDSAARRAVRSTDVSLDAEGRQRLTAYLANHPDATDAEGTVTDRGLPPGVEERVGAWVRAAGADPAEVERRLDALAETPGVVASVESFAALDPRVRRLESREDALRYTLDTGDGVLLVVDDERFVAAEGADFVVRVRGDHDVDHVGRVADGRIRRWRPYRPTDADARPRGEISPSYLDDEEYHGYVVRQARYVGRVVALFEDLPDYSLASVE